MLEFQSSKPGASDSNAEMTAPQNPSGQINYTFASKGNQ